MAKKKMYETSIAKSDMLINLYLEHFEMAGIPLDLDFDTLDAIDACQSVYKMREILHERAGTKTA